MKDFNIAEIGDIRNGLASDVYFERSQTLLKGFPDATVTAEITVSGAHFPWILFSGLDEVITLLEGRRLNLSAIPEGTILRHRDDSGIPVPFITITGQYREFAVLETVMLGFICQSSGISTYSSIVRKACGDTPFFSFGIRRMHPGISPMIDRAAYIGGADGVSGILGARLIDETPVGTLPHAVSIIYGDNAVFEAISKSDKRDGPKVALIDTFEDERFGAVKAAEMIPDLDYVRLDTPSSRRGNFAAIIREVRWELDQRGFNKVKIMVSGGLTAEDIPVLKKAGADAFGVGTSIASGKTVDFSMDIVEVEGKSISKRGKYSGKKILLRCDNCHAVRVQIGSDESICRCGEKMKPMQKEFLTGGARTSVYEKPQQIRKRALEELSYFSAVEAEQ